MEEISLNLLAKKLEKEIGLYMGRGYLHLKIESVVESETILLYISDGKAHLEPMERVDLKDVLTKHIRVDAENVCFVLSDVAKLCVQKYEDYRKRDEKKAEELTKVLNEYPKSQIFCFSAEKVKAVGNFVHRKKGAVSFFYGVILASEKEGEIRYLPFLRTEMLEKWKVSEEDLYQAAKQNARRQPYVIENSGEDYYVIRREAVFWGSTELIYPKGALYELSGELQASLYVLFLSPHELIVVPEREAEKLRETAKATEHDKYLFYYDKDLHEIAVNAVEREEMLCHKRQGMLDVAEKNLLEGHGV